MPQGFEVCNEDGSVRNSVTTFFGKILGQQELFGSGTLAWPYPAVPAGNRAIYCMSNLVYAENQISIAYALFTDAARTTISYSQDMDRAAITLMFFEF